MPRRTELYTKVPWGGGINTSVDPGVLPDSDLIQADNVVFASSGSRLKRQNFLYLDTAFPALVSRSSVGTTRSLVFDATIFVTTPPRNELFSIGEGITITSNDVDESDYVGNFFTLSITTTNTTNDTINYTAAGSLTEADTPVSVSLAIKRSSKYLDVRDYWRLNNAFQKEQYLMAFSSQGKLYRYDSNGRRVEIGSFPEQTQIITVADVAGNLNSKYFTIYDKDGSVGVYFSSGAGVAPGGVDRTIEVTFVNGDADTVIATKLKNTLDADSEFTAVVNGNTVVVTDAFSGDRTDATDTDTTFTITTEYQGLSVTQPFSTGSLSSAVSIVFNERFILCMSGIGNMPIVYRPEDYDNFWFFLPGNPPDFSIMQEHLSRIFTNDKTDPDRMHFTSTANQEEWLGIGDSGAIDISPGDGDPSGIVSINPPFKGRLFVDKQNRIYQVIGDAPENFEVSPISNGIGSISHKAVAAIDFDDILFVSKKGVHSIAATQAHGAYTGQFISQKIQPTFNEWPQAQITKTSCIYVPEINSVAFGISEEGHTNPNAVWLYNTQVNEWYRWPNQSPQCFALRLDGNNNRKLVWGTIDSRVVQALNGDFTDFGDTLAIEYHLKTGRIYPDMNPQTVKGFKKLSFLYKPKGRYNFIVKVKIDNLPVMTYGFTQDIIGDLLGVDFILGTSVLGTDFVFSPFTIPIEGYGRGIELEIINSNKDEQVELYGFIIEYEPADLSQEVV